MLRPYQVTAIESLRRAYGRGRRAPLLVAPTGAGKTVIAAEIIRCASLIGNRALFVAPRKELITQTETKLRDAGIWDVRVIRASHDTGRPDAPVVIGSIQTLTTPRWLGRLPQADLVIADEAHHMVADAWGQLAPAYPRARWLGLTATPERADGRPMGDVFDELVVVASVSELVALEHLAPARVYAPAKELDTAQLAQSPVAAYQRYTPGELAVVFAVTLSHAREIAAEFRAAGVPAGVVFARSPDRDQVLRDFAAGSLRVVVNCGVLTEGWDCPQASVCILARRYGHSGLYLQCVGRVLRPFPGKSWATIIDLTGTVHRHGMPDDDRVYSLTGKAISGVKRDVIRQCPTCGGVFRAGGAECPLCGVALPRRELADLTVVGAEIAEVAPSAPRRPYIRAIDSKYPGTCARCRGPYRAGDPILWSPTLKPQHARCPDVAQEGLPL